MASLTQVGPSRADRSARRPRRDVWLTAITVVLVPTFLGLGYWQLTRALGGNTLSWAYVFEWPLFAGYLLYLWWRLLHEEPRAATSPGRPPGAARAGGDGAGTAGASLPGAPGSPDERSEAPAGERAEEEDEELAAYNRYLAALEESGRRKRW